MKTCEREEYKVIRGTITGCSRDKVHMGSDQ